MTIELQAGGRAIGKQRTVAMKFFQNKTREFKDLYYLYLDLRAAKLAEKEIIKSLSESIIVSFSFPQEVADKTAKILYTEFTAPSFAAAFCDLQQQQQQQASDAIATEEETQSLFISKVDYERYQSLIAADPHVTTEIKHILLALMSVYRRNYHRSGWIRYDRKVIKYLAGLEGIPSKDLEETMHYIHQEYGLQMQVVGSNYPIPCFKFDWMFDQPEPGSHINPFLDFGSFSPETITQISSGTIEPKVIN